MSERPTEALRAEFRRCRSSPAFAVVNGDCHDAACDALDATISAKDRRIAELNRCVGLIRNADAYVMEPKSADAARYWDDALRLANDLYEEPPHA